MKTIKAVFFDFDGTLYSHSTGTIPESTRQALRELRAHNVRCILATGRPNSELKQVLKDTFDFDGYILQNGQLCYGANHEKLYSCPITGEAKDDLLRLFEEMCVPLQLCEEDSVYINYLNADVQRVLESISTPLPKVGTYSGRDFFLATAFADRETMLALESRLHGARMTQWCSGGCDILPAQGGKIVGIKEFLRHFSISREETMAFGDGENDIDMLRYVSIGVAMGNGTELAKKEADYTTADIDNDGIYKALCHFGILGKKELS